MTTRKSFNNLTVSERDKFLEAVLTLKNTIANPAAPSAQQISIYDQFVALHGAAMSLRIPNGQIANFGHGNDLFLPWHRQYLLDFERSLQTVHADTFIPYWDWTQRQATRDVLFQDDFMGLTGERQLHLAGGYFAQAAPAVQPSWWPAGFSGWQVRTEFQDPTWRGLPDNLVKSLIRAGGPQEDLPTGALVQAVIDQIPDYQTFRIVLEHGYPNPVIPLHDQGHLWVGGHMSTGFSPLDPIFFMHHANVDRLWADWQAVDGFRASDLPQSVHPGVDRNDPMWPWIGDAAGYQIINSEIVDLVRDHTVDTTVSADGVLDLAQLGYDYA